MQFDHTSGGVLDGIVLIFVVQDAHGNDAAFLRENLFADDDFLAQARIARGRSNPIDLYPSDCHVRFHIRLSDMHFMHYYAWLYT